jgi:dolichyl-phosphate-mannose-protein mannosyltransferase
MTDAGDSASGAGPEAAAPRRRGLAAVLLAIALAAVQAALLAVIAWDKADTPDEPRYIGGGIVQWSRHDYTSYPHCPVPKWAFGAALRIVEPWIADTPAKSWVDGAHIHLFKHPLWRLKRNLRAARVATIAMTVLGGLLVWAAARRFGDASAAFAHALWCFSPAVLANGSLATLDAWLASLLAGALWATGWLLDAPSWPRAVLSGAAFGLALGTKIVALPWMGTACLALFVRERLGRSSWSTWRRAAALSVVLVGSCLFMLWAVHLFDVGYARVGPLGEREERGTNIGPVPFPTWIQGLDTQAQVGSTGRRNYLFGTMRKEGWLWFYLAVIALKVTLGAQVIGLLRAADTLFRSRGRSLLIDLALVGPPTALVTLLSLSDNQAGMRYLLPAFPFVILWAARLMEGTRVPLTVRVVAWAALGLGAIESMAVHPHSLMFFNVWAGGPEGGPRYLIQGDDWGQDQLRLAEWQQEKGIPGIFYSPFPDNPAAWGIRFREAPCTPRTGVFALHAAEVHRPKRSETGCYDWLTVDPPDERIGYSIYVYFVDRTRLARLQASRDAAQPFFRAKAP